MTPPRVHGHGASVRRPPSAAHVEIMDVSEQPQGDEHEEKYHPKPRRWMSWCWHASSRPTTTTTTKTTLPSLPVTKKLGATKDTKAESICGFVRGWWQWQRQPRHVVHVLVLFVIFLASMLVVLEGMGRLQFAGYLRLTRHGNGELGFYHEMDVNMNALQRQAKHEGAAMFPTSALQLREFQSWITERRHRTNGRKYLVGCSSDWHGYILKSFGYLFEDLKGVHGWSDLETNDPLTYFYQEDPKKAPNVLFFCLNSFHYPFKLLLDHHGYFQRLRALGTLIVVWSDDLHYFDQFDPITVQDKIFKGTDILVNTYAYLVDDYFASITTHIDPHDLPVVAWLPHAASVDFTRAPLNEYPIDKILLSGKLGSSWYPLRNWIGSFQQTHPHLMDIYNHAGYYVADNQSEIYASYLRAYRIAVTTTALHQFLVSKVFELPATGALLLVNNDLEPVMASLGLHDHQHYIGFNRTDPAPMFAWVLDPQHRVQIDQIRANGLRLVREQHMVRDRAMALDLLLTQGIVRYDYPASLRMQAPCPSIALPNAPSCHRAFLHDVRYKCDVLWCGIRSFLQ